MQRTKVLLHALFKLSVMLQVNIFKIKIQKVRFVNEYQGLGCHTALCDYIIQYMYHIIYLYLAISSNSIIIYVVDTYVLVLSEVYFRAILLSKPCFCLHFLFDSDYYKNVSFNTVIISSHFQTSKSKVRAAAIAEKLPKLPCGVAACKRVRNFNQNLNFLKEQGFDFLRQGFDSLTLHFDLLIQGFDFVLIFWWK